MDSDMIGQRQHQNILELFQEEKESNGFLTVAAPMVRYSKLEFRRLLRKHGAKLCFTPMIIADSFNRSENARHNEFTTSEDDVPLIAQFAVKSAEEFVTAAQLIYPYVDGVDVNCGCPQSWAIAKGYGCGLLKQPEKMHDILRTIRRVLPQNFSCSFKVRLLNEDVRSTVELARQLEHCGATFITVHGRTQWQKCSYPLNVSAMSEIKKSVKIPVIVNGNVRSYSDALKLQCETGADGVMAARGLLTNPALFDKRHCSNAAVTATNIIGDSTPIECVQNWLDIAAAAEDKISFQCFHHHLTFMWSKNMKRSLRLQFNSFSRKDEVFDFFEDLYNLKPSKNCKTSVPFYTNCTYDHLKTDNLKIMDNKKDKLCNKPLVEGEQWQEISNGKYYIEYRKEVNNDCNAYDLETCFFLDL